jgi:hypothetical protein
VLFASQILCNNISSIPGTRILPKVSFWQVLQICLISILHLHVHKIFRMYLKKYRIYSNVRPGLFLKFGAYIFEVVFNLHMKHRTGPEHVKPNQGQLYQIVRSVLFWDTKQCRVVIPYRCFRTTYWSQLQGQEIHKKEQTMMEVKWHNILFGTCTSNLFKTHDLSEASSVCIFR